MARARLSTPAERTRSAALAALAVGGIGYALVSGLTVGFAAPVQDALKVFGVPPPSPPPPQEKVIAARQAAPKKEGRASPPNLRAKPVEVMAPPPLVPLPVPPPVLTAPKAGPGSDPSAGAAAVRGPGFGSGGVGDGTGSGGNGNGEGGGGDGGRPLRQIAGRLNASDLPKEVRNSNASVVVHVRFVVGVKGRVTSCIITSPGEYPEMDAKTCPLIVKRFRYIPELDETGRPVAITFTGDQTWYAIDGPPPPEGSEDGRD